MRGFGSISGPTRTGNVVNVTVDPGPGPDPGPSPSVPPSTNMIVWLKPASLVGADGAEITTWTNSINGIGNPTQGTNFRRPTVSANSFGSNSAARWDGSGVSRALGLTGLSAIDRNNCAGVALVKLETLTAYPIGLQSASAAFLAGSGAGTTGTSLLRFSPSANSHRARLFLNQWLIVGFSTNGTHVKIFYNGLLHNPYATHESMIGASNANIAAPSTSTTTSLSFFSDALAGGQSVRGRMIEAMFWNQGISDSEWPNIYNYFKENYSGVISTQKHILCVGDSLTQGIGALASEDWPTQLANQQGHIYHISNQGIQSSEIGVVGDTDLSTKEMPRAQIYAYQTVANGGSYYSDYAKNVACVWFGANDLAPNFYNRTVDTYKARMRDYVLGLKNRGYTVGVSTVIPRGDSTNANAADATGTGNFEWRRAEANSWILANGSYASGGLGADFVVNPCADAAFDAAADSSNTTYYSADKIHLIGAGYAIIASTWKTALDSVM